MRTKISVLRSTTFILAFCFQSLAAADDNQFWSAVALSGPVKEDSRFLLWFDGHARFRDDGSELGVSIIRPGVGWKVNDNLNLWLGYARVTAHLDGPNIDEDRIWQQATYPIATILGGKLSGRTRIEQRSRDLGDDTGYRLRQFFRWARPIEGTRFSFILANETFQGLNNTDWGQRDGFDQNRAYIGGAWQLKPKMRLEAGYLHNRINAAQGSDINNDNLSVALFISL